MLRLTNSSAIARTAPLHERVVALEDGGQEHPAAARNGEDLLHDDRAAEEVAGTTRRRA